ncbi:tRNA (adenosine(37)-N6)-dimethylallyltransferase MiaA [Zhengella mangrovi]|uniref:tRNA dimethylallyltransferase n=1 Tax=Zhengella mangrovi TaxID=1982044 RepID=A0A2G1QQP1_9HYPH|nr:tRNA (adenosine(37)-N6)-dimethylallyltransferase MiaA [Zhengella mangrovi]PHP67805.1 tRNA (adenosine(37)-N6)-dimethylallyltransferase MiaA [Zhengella mangrovi]
MMRTAVENAILIAGPTASGKTALAVDLARKHGGLIINADSMQVYDVLNVLTARPTADELAAAPHVLFGHVSPLETYSTGAWLRDAADVLTDRLQGRRPIFVGGTGLYFRALFGGLSEMPDIPADLRVRLREQMVAEGPEAMHRLLSSLDPAGAETFNPRDGQRILRALEVVEASGKPIAYWQEQRGAALVDDATSRKIVLEPDRRWLRNRITRRFELMMDQGATDEVERLLALSPSPDLPAMKAIGVRQIAAMLSGDLDAGSAIADAITASHQYAKRQSTWFRNQLGPDWERIQPDQLPK